MREISAILTGGQPELGLMFHGHTKHYQYAIKKVPGFISCPFDFNLKKLKEFVEQNANEARIHARDYVKSQQTQSRIQQAI